MARKLFSYEITLTPTANPFTLVVIEPPSAQDVVLSVAEIYPEGTAAAAVPLELVLQKADNTTNMADDSSRIRKVNQFAGSTAVQTKIYKNNAAGEPTFTDTLYEARANVHQQVPGEMRPKNGYSEFVIPAGEKWAIRSIGIQSIPVTIRLNCEE